MPLQEVECLVTAATVEALSDALLEAGALSVSVADADADTVAEQALYGEPGTPAPAPAWERNRLLMLLAAELDPAQVLAAAAAACGLVAPAVTTRRTVPDADWVRLTQAQFAPIAIGRLWVVPSWHEPAASSLHIRLDPGIAFGTGSHPTTRLCLAWLERHLAGGERVLDYGCGSGILSIAAARLGAGLVVGTDIDPLAVEAARYNALRNEVAARYTLPAGLPPPEEQRFDVIAANILANPLVLLAPALAARLAPGGTLVLSGILERQATSVIDAYARAGAGLALSAWGTEDGWVCLTGRLATAGSSAPG